MARKKPDVESPARPANAERGEVVLVLEGAEYVLRPSFEAIEAIEVSTGKGLLELARDAVDGRLRSSEMAQIVCECIRAWGRATGVRSHAGVNAQRVGELLIEAEGGLINAQRIVAGVLAMASTGGYTALGEVKAGAAKATTTTTTTNAASAEN